MKVAVPEAMRFRFQIDVRVSWEYLMTRRTYFLDARWSNTGSGLALSYPSKIETFFFFGGSKITIPGNPTIRLSSNSFFHFK